MYDLLLDQRIMTWVFLPIIYVTFLISMIRLKYSLYNSFTNTKKPITTEGDYNDAKDKLMIAKCDSLAKKCFYLTREAFQSRRNFLCKAETGYLERKGERANNSPNIANLQSGMMDGMKGQMLMMLTTVPAMYWMNYFFAGFVLAKVPISLTQKFRTMTQSGIDMQNLDVRYVSGMSFYILIMFGLGQILTLFIDENDMEEHKIKTINEQRMQHNNAMDPTMGMSAMKEAGKTDQNKNIFKAQIQGLQIIDHKFALDSCPRQALKRLEDALRE